MFSQFNRSCILLNAKIFDPTAVVQLRWRRKPRWLPVAKTKIFRIPTRPVVPIEEKLELLRLNNNYHTQMRAIRRFLFDEMLTAKRSLADSTSLESKKEEASQFERCLLENDAWNESVAKLREARVQRDILNRQEFILSKIEEKDKKQSIIQKAAEKMVLKQLEDSKTFITKDTLDSAIEKALANETNYFFAIDRQGNILKNDQPSKDNKEDEVL